MANFSEPSPLPQTESTTDVVQPEFTPEPLPEPPKLPFTMRANLVEYRKRLGAWRIILAIALLVFIFLRFGYIGGSISAAVVIFTISVTLFFLLKRSFTLRDDAIEHRNAFGTTTQLRYEDISSVKVFMAYIEPAFGHAPRVIIGKKGGGVFFSFSSLYWKLEDIDLLLSTLNAKKVKNETYLEPALSAMVAKQFPDYVGVYERHPYWIAFGIVIAITVAVTIFVIATM